MSIMKDNLEDSKETEEQATYEDELKREEHFIKSQTLIDIIDNIERLVRALRKHIIRK
jgi:methionyl-tRNA formyltransferase